MDVQRQHISSIARANTVVVFHDGDGAQGLLTGIVCRTIDQDQEAVFTGPGKFSERTQEHITQTVYRLVSALASHLGVPYPGLELSAVNLSAASWDQRGLTISGFSADTPIFLAMLAAILGLEVPADFLCTGHIASSDGDIRMVGGLPAKLAAASQEKTIKRFAYPDPMADGSLEPMLTPQEMHEVLAALAEAKRSLALYPVKDVADLVSVSFPPEELVLASLRNGYFNAKGLPSKSSSPIARTATHLMASLPRRFWSDLESRLLAGQDTEAKVLLDAFVSYHIGQKSYSTGFGKRLQGILTSLPASTRRLKIRFPLLPSTMGFRLASFASSEDHPDAVIMLKAIQGELDGNSRHSDRYKEASTPDSLASDSILRDVISLINENSLAERISLPVDSARASYSLDTVLAQSHEAFNDTVTSFVVHLFRRVRGVDVSEPVQAFGAEAFALLERTFAHGGGIKAALLEAQTGAKGGMRYVLDAMTEQFKKEEREKEVQRVLLEALDPLDWDSQVTLIKALLERLWTHLPDDIRDHPPERYANHVGLLARAYVESMDQLNHAFRSL